MFEWDGLSRVPSSAGINVLEVFEVDVLQVGAGNYKKPKLVSEVQLSFPSFLEGSDAPRGSCKYNMSDEQRRTLRI